MILKPIGPELSYLRTFFDRDGKASGRWKPYATVFGPKVKDTLWFQEAMQKKSEIYMDISKKRGSDP